MLHYWRQTLPFLGTVFPHRRAMSAQTEISSLLAQRSHCAEFSFQPYEKCFFVFSAILGATDTRSCDSPRRLFRISRISYVKLSSGRLSWTLFSLVASRAVTDRLLFRLRSTCLNCRWALLRSLRLQCKCRVRQLCHVRRLFGCIDTFLREGEYRILCWITLMVLCCSFPSSFNHQTMMCVSGYLYLEVCNHEVPLVMYVSSDAGDGMADCAHLGLAPLDVCFRIFWRTTSFPLEYQVYYSLACL